jgi:hypothetical protein
MQPGSGPNTRTKTMVTNEFDKNLWHNAQRGDPKVLKEEELAVLSRRVVNH